MSRNPRSFRPGELTGADPAIGDGDLAAAYAAARGLEAAMPADPSLSVPGFTDRVMAAIAVEPQPRPAGFLAGLRAHPGLAGLAGSIREAWAVGTSGPGRPAGVRGLALAYVLAILVIGASVSGVAVYGTAGALRGLLGVDRSSAPSLALPSPLASPIASPADESAEPSNSAEPSESAEPTESSEPRASGSPSRSGEPDATEHSPTGSGQPEASDNNGGSAIPSSSGGDGEGGSPTPSASDGSGGPGSPSPSDSPKPSETPHS
jgi:hypothetical protein